MDNLPRKWDTVTRIDFLQRKIILNSIWYYELNTSKMTDREFDELCKQLVKLQSEIPEPYTIIKDTQYGYVFYDFDGSTGFHLYHRLNDKDKEYLMHIAQMTLNVDVKQEMKEPVEKPSRRKQEKPKVIKKKKGALF